MYPSIGELYPEGTCALADVADEAGLGAVLEPHFALRKIWEIHQAENMDNKSIDDAFYERDVMILENAFLGQMHFGTWLYNMRYNLFFS